MGECQGCGRIHREYSVQGGQRGIRGAEGRGYRGLRAEGTGGCV